MHNVRRPCITMITCCASACIRTARSNVPHMPRLHTITLRQNWFEGNKTSTVNKQTSLESSTKYINKVYINKFHIYKVPSYLLGTQSTLYTVVIGRHIITKENPLLICDPNQPNHVFSPPGLLISSAAFRQSPLATLIPSPSLVVLSTTSYDRGIGYKYEVLVQLYGLERLTNDDQSRNK
ncbi:hypothetical protein ACMFMG_010570 [Clarireedia jacksonii]